MNRTEFRKHIDDFFGSIAVNFKHKEWGCYMAINGNAAVHWHTDEGFSLAIYPQECCFQYTQKPLVMGVGDTLKDALHDVSKNLCMLMQAELGAAR